MNDNIWLRFTFQRGSNFQIFLLQLFKFKAVRNVLCFPLIYKDQSNSNLQTKKINWAQYTSFLILQYSLSASVLSSARKYLFAVLASSATVFLLIQTDSLVYLVVQLFNYSSRPLAEEGWIEKVAWLQSSNELFSQSRRVAAQTTTRMTLPELSCDS